MKKSFTMLELVLVIVIVVIVSTALMSSLITCMALNDNSRMMTIAMNIARDKLEDIINRKGDWDTIVNPQGPYGINILSLPPAQGGYNFDGSCQVTVHTVNSTLKLIRVVVCWRLRNGRVVGSDANFNGLIDDATHVVWQGIQVHNSPVVIVTAISRG